MIPFFLGTDLDTGRRVELNPDIFRTHFHLIGATGTGKTTAIRTLLRPILLEPTNRACVFLIDPMGGLSNDLLHWIADEHVCPQHVRDRLLYIEPSREDVVLTYNPLLFETEAHEYYQVERAVDIILRAWDSQDLAAMPRLRRWTFNSFFSAARLGFPISVCNYLLLPGTEEHQALIRHLPPQLQAEWLEIYRSRGSEAVRILDSTRNRLSPFFDSVILRRMFGSVTNNFDVERFIHERRIVIVNVSKRGKLSPHLGHTIGSFMVNEILEKAQHLSETGTIQVAPTYVVLDEFQHFVGQDLADALPIMRQTGLRLLLAHQSFAQLEKGDLDLSGIIWQARSRLIFANDGEDADRLAHEIAMLKFDPQKIKHQLTSHRQRVVGFRKMLTESRSTARSLVDTWNEQKGSRTSKSTARTLPSAQLPGAVRDTSGSDFGSSQSAGGSSGQTDTSTTGETYLPIHEDFQEIVNVTFETFEEFRTLWGGNVRKLNTGEGYLKAKDDPEVYHILVDEYRPLFLPRMAEAVAELKEVNFQDELFVSASQIDHEAEQLRRRLLQPPQISLPSPSPPSSTDQDQGPSPFRGD